MSQREVGEHSDKFADALHSALREDPDVILVGEMRDLETISIAVTAAEMGIPRHGHPAYQRRRADRRQNHQLIPVRQAVSYSHDDLDVVARRRIAAAAADQATSRPGRGAGGTDQHAAVGNLIRQGKLDQLETAMQSGGAVGMQTMDSALMKLVEGAVVSGKEAYLQANNKKQAIRERLKDARLKDAARKPSTKSGCSKHGIIAAFKSGQNQRYAPRRSQNPRIQRTAVCQWLDSYGPPGRVSAGRYLGTLSRNCVATTCTYVCASDVHGTPVMLKARELGVSPEELTEKVTEEFLRDFSAFGIEFDNYYTTHSPENEALVGEIFHVLRESGDIYTKTIEQAYDEQEGMFLPDRFVRGTCPRCSTADQYGDACENCGATYDPTDLIDPISVLSGARRSNASLSTTFFALSEYEDRLRQWMS